MTTKHGAEELADGLLKAMSALIAHISTYKDGYKFQLEKVNIFTQSATRLRQQQAEIEALKEALIKSKELLEQGEEVDFDDMMHIEILLEDACEVRELIEKTLNKGKDDGDE